VKKILILLLTLFLAAPLAEATWSIVIVNTRTGEVGIAVASCTPQFDLHVGVPVIVVGHGSAVWQANGDATFKGRPAAWSTLMAGGSAQEAIDLWLANDPFSNGKQAAVASLDGDAVPHTTPSTGAWSGHVSGVVGDYIYAVQGNVLTGQAVVDATAAALESTAGDMGQRLIAAMEAGTTFGGDGRCSCSSSAPTSCGAPPPDFDVASKSGFIIVARMGDLDGICDQTVGCGNGDYWLDLNYVGPFFSPDAVGQLRLLYDDWRGDMAGRPDGLKSTALASAQSIPADGVTTMEFEVQLADIDGNPLNAGVPSFSCVVNSASTSDAVCTATVDLGGGRYSVTVGQATIPGVATLDFIADDGVTRATLYPSPSVRVDSTAPLHVGFDAVDAANTTSVPLVINAPESAGSGYILLASLSGTVPGIPIGNVILPLNMDETLVRTWSNANDQVSGGNARLKMTRGFLDAGGRAQGAFDVPPGLLLNLVGTRIDWAALTFDNGKFGVTNAAGFQVVHGSN
jgi:hypothetical protein